MPFLFYPTFNFPGPSPGMLDYHIYPWFERFPFLKEKRNVDILENCPGLRGWFERMAQNPVVMATAFPAEAHIQVYEMRNSGKYPGNHLLVE